MAEVLKVRLAALVDEVVREQGFDVQVKPEGGAAVMVTAEEKPPSGVSVNA